MLHSMVGVAWTGAPWPGFRHSHAPGQGGGMAMLLCYLLAASSPTPRHHHHQCCQCSSFSSLCTHPVLMVFRSPSCSQIVFDGQFQTFPTQWTIGSCEKGLLIGQKGLQGSVGEDTAEEIKVDQGMKIRSMLKRVFGQING